MKFLYLVTASLLLQAGWMMASSAPVRLALISDSGDAAAASDLLTAALSGNTNFQLLERDEVQKIYREQGLSAANGNEVRLGRLLGADGVLLLKLVNPLGATNLAVRLIAVKPGVVLTDISFTWPVSDGPEWAKELATRLNVFAPKLALLNKDAIPVSLVNLRCAVASPGALDLERTLTMLTLRRLSREPRLFILERRKLQLLSEEKRLNADESAFWNGSYLLDGVIDQQGVSMGLVTLDARLVPPKGGAPISFKVSSARTNLAEVINELALKVTHLLEVNSTVLEWKSAEEAAAYFDESKWALRWRCFAEAQSAADSAWVLGKTDLECALARIEAYRGELAAFVAPHQRGSYFLGPSHDNEGRAVTPPPGENAVQAALARLKAEHPFGFDYRIARDPVKASTEISYTFMHTPPDPVNVERATRLLELYQNLSAILASGWSPPTAPGAPAQKAQWQNAGLEVLVTASKVLRNFYFNAPSRSSADGGLPELRTQARKVAQQIYQSKAAQDSYFVGNRVVTHDELAHTMPGSIFECMLTWGVWWHEKPEDALVLYRELTTSPVFSFIHENFWLRDLENPRLVGWNEADRRRLPSVWEQFMQELAASSNALCQLEAKALAVADAPNPADAALAATDLFSAMLQRREALVTNNVEVLYLQWGVLDLISAKVGGSLTEHTRQLLAELTAMQEDWRKHVVKSRAEPGPPAITNSPKPSPPAPGPEAVVSVTVADKFLPIPLESIGEDISAAIITAHHWQEERLILDLSCRRNEVFLDEHGKFKGNRLMVRNAIALLDPATTQWTVLPSQDESDADSITRRNRFYHHTALCRGQVFTCDFGRVRKYDVATRAWQDVEACERGNYELFAFQGRLFVADNSSILEIVDEGKSMRVLASNRRRPAASTLDTEELGEPTVFEGPDHSLRACTKNKIVGWFDGDWHVVCPAPPRTWPPVLSPEGLLFATDGWNQHWCISRLATAADSIDLCFGSLRRPPIGVAPPSAEPKPKWKLPPGVNLADLYAASRQPDLYLLVDHAKSEGVFDKTLGSITSKRAVPQDGYHAALLCFCTNGASPLRLGLRFESGGADPPVTGEHALAGAPTFLAPRAWLLFAGKDVFLGREHSLDGLGSGNGSRNPPEAGVWRIPLAQLDRELAVQRQASPSRNQ